MHGTAIRSCGYRRACDTGDSPGRAQHGQASLEMAGTSLRSCALCCGDPHSERFGVFIEAMCRDHVWCFLLSRGIARFWVPAMMFPRYISDSIDTIR